MNEEKDIYTDYDYDIDVENEIMPTTSVNEMLRTTAFTARQSGGSFLVRHGDSGVWLYHLGGETDEVRIVRREWLPVNVWLHANSWNVAWPTVGEQFERLQGEADEQLYLAHRKPDYIPLRGPFPELEPGGASRPDRPIDACDP